MDQEGLDQHKETLFKVVHITTNFNVTLQAFMLLYQVQGESEAQDRFYSGKTKSTIYHLSSEKRGVCMLDENDIEESLKKFLAYFFVPSLFSPPICQPLKSHI